jgi:hypothetical protein
MFEFASFEKLSKDYLHFSELGYTPSIGCLNCRAEEQTDLNENVGLIELH